MPAFRIVRTYFETPRYHRTIVPYSPLEQALEYCRGPESFSFTATSPAARRRSRRVGPWFDAIRPL